jgi:hypothetical protein
MILLDCQYDALETSCFRIRRKARIYDKTEKTKIVEIPELIAICTDKMELKTEVQPFLVHAYERSTEFQKIPMPKEKERPVKIPAGSRNRNAREKRRKLEKPRM